MIERLALNKNTRRESRSFSREPTFSQIVLQSVTVQGHGLVLSIVHLPPLTIDSPFMFTILIIFLTDTFQYIVW